MAPGAAAPPHRHRCEEVVLATRGEGEVHVGGTVHRFTAGQWLEALLHCAPRGDRPAASISSMLRHCRQS